MKFMRKNGGFTLVELIVVIAILAILAGVAVPAYSGYIKKANEAADNQLLGAVNTAFAAACIQEGIDINTLTAANIDLNDDGTIKMDSIQPAALQSGFATYYAGNTGSAFKVFTSLYFDKDLHCFVKNEGTKMAWGGGYITLNDKDIEALKNSGWMNYEGLGTDALLGKIDYVTNLGAGMLNDGGALSDVVNSDAYMSTLAATMGYDINTQGLEFEQALNNMAQQKAEQLKNNPEYAGKTDEELYAIAGNQILANGAVLSAAQNAANMNQSDITTLLGSGNATTTIKNNLQTDPEGALAQAALAYGMYTSYAYSTGDQAMIDKSNDPSSILNALDDPAFQAYINSDKGQADMEGYLAGLNMINESSKDSNAASNVLLNGFNDKDLAALLQGATGGK